MFITSRCLWIGSPAPLAGSSGPGSLVGLQSKCWQGLWCHLTGEDPLRAHHQLLARSVLMSCWPGASFYSLSRRYSHMMECLITGQLSKREAGAGLCSPVVEVASHHLSASHEDQPHTRGWSPRHGCPAEGTARKCAELLAAGCSILKLEIGAS